MNRICIWLLAAASAVCLCTSCLPLLASSLSCMVMPVLAFVMVTLPSL